MSATRNTVSVSLEDFRIDSMPLSTVGEEAKAPGGTMTDATFIATELGSACPQILNHRSSVVTCRRSNLGGVEVTDNFPFARHDRRLRY